MASKAEKKPAATEEKKSAVAEKALVEKKPKAGKKLPKEGGAAATDKKKKRHKKSVETYKIYIFKVLRKRRDTRFCASWRALTEAKQSNKDIMYYTLKASPYLHNYHSLNLDKSGESEANNNNNNNNNNNYNNNSKGGLVVGYALTTKKIKSFLQPKLERLAW
ncbi:hypothetical protein ACFE04_005813 [Oxalis oulophora]